MTRFAVYTRKKRIIAHRRSSDGTVPRRSSFYRKKNPVSQVKTCENKAKNSTFFVQQEMRNNENETTMSMI